MPGHPGSEEGGKEVLADLTDALDLGVVMGQRVDVGEAGRCVPALGQLPLSLLPWSPGPFLVLLYQQASGPQGGPVPVTLVQSGL